MITLVILPFLLVIHTSMSDDSHQHVPVYAYSAQVSCYSLNLTSNLKTKSFHMMSTMKCHPRAPTILNCRIDNAAVATFKQELLDLGVGVSGTWELDAEPFDIHFDRKGVVMVHMNNNRMTWMTGMVKLIVDQLNIGFDLSTQPHCGTFVTKERSYIGNCQTAITMNQKLSDMEHVWPDISAYGIILLRNREIGSREELQIVKERNLKHCSIDYDSILRRKAATSSIYRHVPMKMTSSMSRIIISGTNYTSLTVNDFLAKSLITGENVQLSEEITLVLDSVSTKNIDSSQNHLSDEKYYDLLDKQYTDLDAMAQAA